MSYKILVFSILIAITYSCAPTRFVEPLKKKELAIGGNMGGPVIEFGSAFIPIPLSAVEVGYGIDTNFTIHGGLHTTAMIFGNIQVDAGITYKVLNQDNYIPNVSLSPSINFIYDIDDKLSKLWPTIDMNAYWNYGKRKSYFYFGLNNIFELSKTMAFDQEQKQRWILSPQIGHVFKTKSERWQITTELKFLALNQNNSSSFIPYKTLSGNYGATGFYLGFRYILK